MLLPLVLLASAWEASSMGKMDVIHSWKTPDFNFPSQEMRNAMLRTKSYIPENVAMIDVDVWEDFNTNRQKIFVTMPRLKPGIPATIATVGLTGKLDPYPSWNWHQEGDCEGITSVFRVDIDQCGRLWILDTGNVEVFTNPRKICPPQILVFDLYTDRLLDRYRIPDDRLESKSLLITIAVDTRGPKCEDTFAYIADVTGYKLIVFDAQTETSWRANNRYLYPYPTSSLFDINGVSFELTDGVMGLALGPVNNNGDRRLYFHSFASHKENWVPTSVLQNRTLLTAGDPKMEFRLLEGGRPSQAAAEAMTPSGVLFFGLVTENSIACWNSRLSYTNDNIIRVAKDDARLQFASGVKIRNGFVWALTSRFQNYFVNRVATRETNYRIVAGSLALLTHGTSCHYPSDSYVFHQPVTRHPVSTYDKNFWNPFTRDKRTLQFASGIKTRKGRVWALTSRLQNYIDGHVPMDDTNYRVVMGEIAQLTRGTKCHVHESTSSSASSSFANNSLAPPKPSSSGYGKPFIFKSR